MTIGRRLAALETARAAHDQVGGILFTYADDQDTAQETVLVGATGACLPAEQFSRQYPQGRIEQVIAGVNPHRI